MYLLMSPSSKNNECCDVILRIYYIICLTNIYKTTDLIILREEQTHIYKTWQNEKGTAALQLKEQHS